MKIREFYFLALMIILFIALYFINPFKAVEVYKVSFSYLKEMIIILPAVFILMGLFEVWVPKDFITRHLGIDSGIKGIFLSFIFGTLPTGPLYIAFPVAAALLKKGARTMNIAIFLGAWASAKIPQIMVELKFLGLEFTIIRFILTFSSIIIIGFLIEFLMRHQKSSTVSLKKG